MGSESENQPKEKVLQPIGQNAGQEVYTPGASYDRKQENSMPTVKQVLQNG